jgi:hypothetical protein
LTPDSALDLVARVPLMAATFARVSGMTEGSLSNETMEHCPNCCISCKCGAVI